MAKDSIKAIEPYPIKPVVESILTAAVLLTCMAPIIPDETRVIPLRRDYPRLATDFAHLEKSPVSIGVHQRPLDRSLSRYKPI